MYRLQVYYRQHWKWGLNSYQTFESASMRVKELKKVGIKSRIKLEKELLK